MRGAAPTLLAMQPVMLHGGMSSEDTLVAVESVLGKTC